MKQDIDGKLVDLTTEEVAEYNARQKEHEDSVKLQNRSITSGEAKTTVQATGKATQLTDETNEPTAEEKAKSQAGNVAKSKFGKSKKELKKLGQELNEKFKADMSENIPVFGSLAGGVFENVVDTVAPGQPVTKKVFENHGEKVLVEWLKENPQATDQDIIDVQKGFFMDQAPDELKGAQLYDPDAIRALAKGLDPEQLRMQSITNHEARLTPAASDPATPQMFDESSAAVGIPPEELARQQAQQMIMQMIQQQQRANF